MVNNRSISKSNNDDIMTPDDLGRKLVIALRSVSDPQALMQEISDRTASTVRNELFARIEAMDKATTLWHEDLVRVPTEVQKAVTALHNLLDQSIAKTAAESRVDHQQEMISISREVEKVYGLITTLSEVSEERFKGIQIQFNLLKQATEQLDLANKAAIAVALQAQKDSASETQKSSQAATAKSETSTSEAIKALTAAFNTAIVGITDRVNDLKGRLDRGEGKTSYSDPEMAAKVQAISQQLAILTTYADRNTGGHSANKDYTAMLLSVGAVVISVLISMLYHH
jgi:hypothetical protein